MNSGALQATPESLSMIADVNIALSQLVPLLDPAGPAQHENAARRIAKVREQLPQTLTAKEQRHVEVLNENDIF